MRNNPHSLRPLIATAIALILLCGCAPKKPWHASDVSGSLPDLAFKMTRASDGATVTAENFKGRVVLLYFGYTHCPDVCPTTLADLGDVLQKLGKDRDKIRVLFVSVDPGRDSIEILKAYARSFGPEFEGLRGQTREIAATAKRYNQAFSVRTKPEYVVMHTSAVTVFDDHGKARLQASDTHDTAGLAEDLKRVANGE